MTNLLLQEETKKHFEDAMEHGYVECTMTTCAVTGAAGSGKSHTMSLVFNEDPPAVRESTGLCEPVRAISTVVGTSDSGSSEWTLVDEDKVLSVVTGAATMANTKEQPTKQTSLLPAYASYEASSDAKASSNTSRKTEEHGFHMGVVDELLEKLARLLRVPKGRRWVTKLEFLYFLDSGGQPQFHELLPSFVPNLSAILFVLKLSEKLSHNPEVEFYEKGKLVCSYQSPHSHEQILKRCIRALQPENKSIESSSSSSPCIAIVGTHRDLELSCEGETREKKNQILLDLLQPTFDDNLIFFDNLKRLIFPVNAKEPNEEDRAVASVLRKGIICLSAKKPVNIPLPWFILEQVLRKLAKLRGTGVLHIHRCREVAETLYIKHDAFDAALKYLVSLKVFLYYLTVLPNVLFCEPQVALDKINELVDCYHTLCGGSNTLKLPGNAASASMRVFSGKKWIRFQRFGVFQEKLLHDKAFSGHYDQDLFTPSDLLKLLEALRIVGKVNTTDVIPEYVMPSLLFELKPDDLDKHRCNPTTSPAAPLLVHFPDEWPTSGVFCSFLTSLLSAPCEWEVMIDERNRPTCLYRNCLEFQHPEMLGKITLIDSFDHGYFEVHVHAPLEECKKFCPEIRQTLFTVLPPKAPKAELAYFCPNLGSACCSSSLHLARILPQRQCWRCSEKPGEVYGSLAEVPNIAVWGSGAGISLGTRSTIAHNYCKHPPPPPPPPPPPHHVHPCYYCNSGGILTPSNPIQSATKLLSTRIQHRRIQKFQRFVGQ